MNKAYFKESFTSGFKMMLFILIIGILVYPLIILTTKYNVEFFYAYDKYGHITDVIIDRWKSSPDVGIVIAYLAVLCYFVPVLKFSYLQKKRQIDTYYALPIKRQTLTNVNLLVGYLQIIIPYTIVYFLGMGILALKADFFHYIFYIPLYFITILISLGVYLFNSFIFSRGNTILDGLFLMVAYTLVGMMVVMIFSSTFHLDDEFQYGITFSPFIEVGNHFAELIMYYGEENKYNTVISDISLWNYIFPIILIIIGYLGLFFSTKTDCAERAEQITNSYFGYRVIVPFYFSSAIYWLAIEGDFSFLFIVLLIVLYLIVEVIHYRKFKLPMKVFIVLISCLVGAILISLVGAQISEYYAHLDFQKPTNF